MDRRSATVVGAVFAVVLGGIVYMLADAAVLAGASGIAWGVAAGVRSRSIGRDASLDGPDWWTATTVSVALLVAVPGLAYLPIPPELRLALGVALLGVGAAGAALGEARERAVRSDAADRDAAAT